MKPRHVSNRRTHIRPVEASPGPSVGTIAVTAIVIILLSMFG